MYRVGEWATVTGRVEKTEKTAEGHRLVMTLYDLDDLIKQARVPQEKAEQR